MARQHPGETGGSFMVHGLIEFLTSPDPRAEFLRYFLDLFQNENSSFNE
jgi:hypothetical protein